jgi:hypothetical protein
MSPDQKLLFRERLFKIAGIHCGAGGLIPQSEVVDGPGDGDDDE